MKRKTENKQKISTVKILSPFAARTFVPAAVALASLFVLSAPARAQVNLDLPVPVGSYDKVYQSSADAGAAYYLPLKLETLSPPHIAEVDGEYHLTFTVGVNPADLATVNNQLVSLKKPFTARIMHGLEIQFDPVGPTDISRKFTPKLTPLGDPGDFGGPLPYMLSIKKIGPSLGKVSQRLIAETFNGKSARHLGTMAYQFNAVLGGKPYLAKTAVAIFATTALASKSKSETASGAGLSGLRFGSFLLSSDPALSVKLDSQSSCWENVRVGEVCLR